MFCFKRARYVLLYVIVETRDTEFNHKVSQTTQAIKYHHHTLPKMKPIVTKHDCIAHTPSQVGQGKHWSSSIKQTSM